MRRIAIGTIVGVAAATGLLALALRVAMQNDRAWPTDDQWFEDDIEECS